ncbi:MAG: MFS transporter [Kiritimatiellae bacterium]|nr:MFS transporter [Kiritimatiellia bacterium]
MPIAERVRRMNPQLRLFLAGIFLLGITNGIFETTFNNFLHDRFDLAADARGLLEFPRELPGFLTALFAGLLFFLSETFIAAVCAFAVAAGMVGLGIWGTGWNAMLAFMVIWSVGTHLIMPVQASVAMALADENRRGRRLGQVQGVGVAAAIVGCSVVWITLRYLKADYRITFFAGAAAALLAGLFFLPMRLPGVHLKRPKFVWNRRYWLFYVLAFLFGARKQIFITFGPWVLVKIFRQQAYVFAQLWIAAALLGVFFQPALGRIIDRYGERKVLIADSLFIFAICMGYGFSSLIGNRQAALGLLFACYVFDQLLFGVNMARNTYLAKIAVRREDVAPTLSMGVTINHAVSMSVPALGGLLWVRFGHGTVFLAAAVVALLMLVFSSRVRC